MVNRGEPLLNVVTENKPKRLKCVAHRLGPKGKGSSIGAANSPIADVGLPAKRQSLTHAIRVLARNVVRCDTRLFA